LPVLVRDASEAALPAWQASQVRAFLDPDAMAATFSLGGREVLKAPLA